VSDRVKAISEVGIPVVGHIGLTPQTASLAGGYKAQGKTVQSAKRIIEDAVVLQDCGASAIVLEFTAAEVARLLSERLKIPTIGWGSGPHCDGIGLNISDILGFSLGLVPRFAKQYTDLHQTVVAALTSYRLDVQEGRFPEEMHSTHMDKAEYEALLREMT